MLTEFTSNNDIFKLRRGDSKLIVSMPHVGTKLPDCLIPRMRKAALTLPDTDWYLEELYDFLLDMDVTLISANYSRYVVDLNRSPNDISLYPGHDVTGLCPIDTFAGELIYKNEPALTELEISSRLDAFWYPYHQALETEIARIKSIHGHAVLWDAHSIRSTVPRFFEGKLPELNIGTAGGGTLQLNQTEKLVQKIKDNAEFSWVVNGRFKGGYITRHYGNADDVNAVQLEIALRAYLDESVLIPQYDITKARNLKSLLKTMLESLLD